MDNAPLSTPPLPPPPPALDSTDCIRLDSSCPFVTSSGGGGASGGGGGGSFLLVLFLNERILVWVAIEHDQSNSMIHLSIHAGGGGHILYFCKNVGVFARPTFL